MTAFNLNSLNIWPHLLQIPSPPPFLLLLLLRTKSITVIAEIPCVLFSGLIPSSASYLPFIEYSSFPPNLQLYFCGNRIPHSHNCVSWLQMFYSVPVVYFPLNQQSSIITRAIEQVMISGRTWPSTSFFQIVLAILSFNSNMCIVIPQSRLKTVLSPQKTPSCYTFVLLFLPS